MIELVNGNIFESGSDALVNPVNCVGVMGKGLALEFKKRFPVMYQNYVVACRQKLVQVGKVWIYPMRPKPTDPPETPKYIINFPTKDDWRNPSQLQWIVDGLDDLRNHETLKEMKSISLPALGCGLGGLDFMEVCSLIEEKLGHLPKVIVYRPR